MTEPKGVDSIVDRRSSPKGSSLGNRQRFVRRTRAHIRRAIREKLKGRGITDVDSGETISIPADGVHEPRFVPDTQTGGWQRVLPGNREFHEGDRIARPDGDAGGAGGTEGSDAGSAEDAFTFTLSRDEFMDLFFEDLELPDLVKRRLVAENSSAPERAGFSTSGPPNRMNLERTMRQSMARRVALGRPSEAALAALEKELEQLRRGELRPADGRSREARVQELVAMLERARERRRGVPYIDPLDVRFNYFEQRPRPVARAVMFCLMDVSASMDEAMKDLAKRFFMLLHLFLRRQYKRVEVVFIRHTQHAEVVDEETFFHSRQTGGTVVSTAFEEMLQVIERDYPADDWNIYLAQASDGDDLPDDVGRCVALLSDRILPVTQYAAYVEIARSSAHPMIAHRHDAASELWSGYRDLEDAAPNFAMRRIADATEIYPVFRDLFRREGAVA
jgi:uncharacterized protein